jgi:hypothetical protein
MNRPIANTTLPRVQARLWDLLVDMVVTLDEEVRVQVVAVMVQEMGVVAMEAEGDKTLYRKLKLFTTFLSGFSDRGGFRAKKFNRHIRLLRGYGRGRHSFEATDRQGGTQG